MPPVPAFVEGFRGPHERKSVASSCPASEAHTKLRLATSLMWKFSLLQQQSAGSLDNSWTRHVAARQRTSNSPSDIFSESFPVKQIRRNWWKFDFTYSRGKRGGSWVNVCLRQRASRKHCLCRVYLSHLMSLLLIARLFVHIRRQFKVQEISVHLGARIWTQKNSSCVFLTTEKCKCRWCNVHSLSLNQRAVSAPAGIAWKKIQISLPISDTSCCVNGRYLLDT